MTPYDKYQEPMIKELKEQILNQGFFVLNKTSTRTRDNINSRPSCIDLMITNRTDKIISHQSGLPGFSDHSVQILTRKTKEIKSINNILRIRSFKKNLMKIIMKILKTIISILKHCTTKILIQSLETFKSLLMRAFKRKHQ